MRALQAPFPWFGGKSRIAHIVWDRFGDVPNYVEPFAGSLAVLLARPHAPQTETVNDLDCYLSNFWRAVKADPEAVAAHADWPVNEADILARHRWLLAQAEFRERIRADADYFDAKVAGWWAWGICSWIGSGWCRVRGDGPPSQLPHLGNAGMGLHRKLPHLGNAGMGLHRKLPHLGSAGRVAPPFLPWFEALSERLRRVRVACGDWTRILGESVTVKHGATAVLLDPPYSSEEHSVEYGAGPEDVAGAVREWALANGENPALRIALCGYEGEHEMPETWDCVPWKSKGGYSSKGHRGYENRERERVWFSPHCLSDSRIAPLFAEGGAA